MFSCTLHRVEAYDLAFPVLLNDQPVELPALHAMCTFPDGREGHLYVLDELDNPMKLWGNMGVLPETLQMVRIELPPAPAAPVAATSPIEAALAERKAVEIYGIYFNFNSDAIRPQSTPVLQQIAGILQRNPDWKLSVGGHTDNVGEDGFNLNLSQRRAEAVKSALVTQYKIVPGRLRRGGSARRGRLRTTRRSKGGPETAALNSSASNAFTRRRKMTNRTHWLLSTLNKRGRNGAVTAMILVGLFLVASCKKAPAPAPAVQAGSRTGPAPAIQAQGTAFDPGTWTRRRTAAEQNISVGAGNSHASVSYAPAVKVIDQAAVDASFVGLSSDGHGAVFKNASAEIRALKANDIFLVKNQFAVKVLAAENDGDQTVLIIDTAHLADVIASGSIHIDSPITFHGRSEAAAAHPFRFRDFFDTPVYAQTGTGTAPSGTDLTPSYSTPKPGLATTTKASAQAGAFLSALTSGWTVESWNVTPGNNTAAISARMTKDAGGFLAAVTMNGTISNFSFVQQLSFPLNATQIADGVHGMSGQMHFTWEIGKNTPGGWSTEDKLKLPAGVTIPLGPVLEGLPLTLDISAALLIHPGLTGGNEYSKGGFTIGFNGSGSGEGLTFTVDADQSISPAAPNAMVISFCVPRIELQMGLFSSYASNKTLSSIASTIDIIVSTVMSHLPANLQAALAASPMAGASVTNLLASKADVYVQIIHTEGVTHAANMTLAPCSKQELKVTGQTGGDASLFGKTASSNTKDLFTKSFTRWDPASAFCKSI